MQLAMWSLVLAIICLSTRAGAFTVCAVHNPPFTICPSATFDGFVQSDDSISGFDVDMLRKVLTGAGYSWDATAGYAHPKYMKYAWRCSPALTWDSVKATTSYGTLSSGAWPSTAVPASATDSRVSLPYACDIGVGAFTVNSAATTAGSMFIPYYATGAAVVTASVPATTDMWSFVKPFHWSLWLGFLCFAIIVPATVFFVERLSVDGVLPLNKEGLHEWRMAQYQTFLAIFNLQVYDVVSVAAQVNIISFCFMILIVVQTYNAQLGALYLNSGSTSIQSMSDLHDRSVGVISGNALPLQQKYNKVHVVPYKASSTDDLVMQALAAIDSGAVNAFVHDIHTLTPRIASLPDPCKYRVLVSPLVYKFSYGFLFSNGWNSSQVASSFYVSLMRAQEDFYEFTLSDKYLPSLPTCVTGGSTTGSSVTFRQLSGLFIVVGAATGAALLACLLHVVLGTRRRAAQEEGGHANRSDQLPVAGPGTRKSASFPKAVSKGFVMQEILPMSRSSKDSGAASAKSSSSFTRGAAPRVK